MTLADLTAISEPLAAVVSELPQRDIGGLLPQWDDLVAQTNAMRERGAAIHLDGARLWEAQTHYRQPFADIVALFDTAYVSLYKGLQGTVALYSPAMRPPSARPECGGAGWAGTSTTRGH